MNERKLKTTKKEKKSNKKEKNERKKKQVNMKKKERKNLKQYLIIINVTWRKTTINNYPKISFKTRSEFM